MDVVEIDAASHGGVDDARELREKAPTAPMVGREKVYIIDEAQRLSREAFDALLKLFEEPPPGVRFVLATTEPHKMPATIVGRCQRFDFRRLTIEGLAQMVQTIASSEGVALDPAAAHAIARRAEGSARDAPRCWTRQPCSAGRRSTRPRCAPCWARPVARSSSRSPDVVAVGDVRGVFEVVDRLVLDGRDVRNVTNETIGHFRDLLARQDRPGQEDLLDLAADAYEGLRVQAEKFSAGELARILALLLAAQNDMRWTTSPRLSLELALIRACLPDTDPTPAGVVSRLERLERLANLAPEAVVVLEEPAEAPRASGRRSRRSASGRRHRRPPTDESATQMPVPQAADAGSVDVAMLRRSWGALIDHLGQLRQPIPPRRPRERDGRLVRRRDARARVPARQALRACRRCRIARTSSSKPSGTSSGSLRGSRASCGSRASPVARRPPRSSRRRKRPATTRLSGASRRCWARPRSKGAVTERVRGADPGADRRARTAARHRAEVRPAARVLARQGAARRRQTARVRHRPGEGPHRVLPGVRSVAEGDLCRICRDEGRDRTVLCIVEEPKDAATIEKSALHKGRYHILGGAISPLDGVGPEDLRVQELLDRVERDHVTECILATNPNLEGNATAMYVAALLKPSGVRVTRLASGLPVGGDLEYVDDDRCRKRSKAAGRSEWPSRDATRTTSPSPATGTNPLRHARGPADLHRVAGRLPCRLPPNEGGR
mgnify:CR=1 FL=1